MTYEHVRDMAGMTQLHNTSHFQTFCNTKTKFSASTRNNEENVQDESTPCNVTVNLTWLLHCEETDSLIQWQEFKQL